MYTCEKLPRANPIPLDHSTLGPPVNLPDPNILSASTIVFEIAKRASTPAVIGFLTNPNDRPSKTPPPELIAPNVTTAVPNNNNVLATPEIQSVVGYVE